MLLRSLCQVLASRLVDLVTIPEKNVLIQVHAAVRRYRSQSEHRCDPQDRCRAVSQDFPAYPLPFAWHSRIL